MADLDSKVYLNVQYESDLPVLSSDTQYGFLVRILPRVLTLEVNATTNAAPDAELITPIPIFARTSGYKNRFGVITRRIIISRVQGASPTQNKIYRSVPLLTIGIFNALLPNVLANIISYEGETDWELVSVRPENYGKG